MLTRVLIAILAATSAVAVSSPLPEYPFVFATGTARRDLPPDTAKVEFTVAARNKGAAAAAGSVDSTFEVALKICAAADIRKSDVDASTVNKTARSHWDSAKDQSVPDGYEVSRHIKVTVRDLTRFPQMVRELLKLSGAESFSSEFERSDKIAIQEELFTLAAKDAREQAGKMAASFDRKLGPAHAIARVPFDTLPSGFGFSDGGSVGGALMEIVVTGSSRTSDIMLVPSKITLSESVNVVYELQ